MDSINGMPLIWDSESDKNLFGKLFQTQTDNFLVNQNPVTNNSNTFKSPFSESQSPNDGSFLKLDTPLSIFSDDFSYIIRIEKVKTGSEVLNAYNNRSVAENEIVFFCEETNPNNSNLFKTFVLVKYGSKYKELIYNLKCGISLGIVSRIKNTTTGIKIKSFSDEVQDNFDRIKNLGIDVEIKTIRFVMENELQVTNSTSKTVAEMYTWYNNGISYVVDGVNDWLEKLKFSCKDYLPAVKKEKSDDLLDAAIKGIDYLIPEEIEKFVSDTLENALTEIAKYSKENLPQTWVVFLKRIYDTIKGYLNLFKQNIEKINEFVGEAFLLARALLMGFVNGLISTVQTLLSLIGWLLKTNGYKKLTGEYYRELNSNLEFIEDFLDLVSAKANDFFNAVYDLMNDFSLEKIKDTIKVFGNKFKELTRYDYAFFAGSFVFEVVLGVVLAFFTGGASLVAEAANVAEKQIAIFKLILKEIVSTATMGVIDILKLFKILITKFAQACKNGWAGFKNFLEKILANKADDVLKEEKFFDDYIKLSNELVEATKSKTLLQKTNNLDKLYDEAKVANKELKITTNNFATETNGKPGFRDGLKSKERAIEKIESDYAGDASRLVDIAGSKVVYETIDDLYIALNKFNKEYKILKIKDRIQKPLNGYRDILMNIEMKNGHIVEFRLHIREMDEVVDGIGRKIYEEVRNIKSRAIIENRKLTLVEFNKINELENKSLKNYDDVWKKIIKK